MRKERKKLENIIKIGNANNSITELYDRHFKGGNISNRNGLIYLFDVPDNIKSDLPPNVQRWSQSSDTLLTSFNRWLWNFGKNAPDLEETWKRENTSPGKVWAILTNAFTQNMNDSEEISSYQNAGGINTSLSQREEELEAQEHFEPTNDVDARTRIEPSIVQRYGQSLFGQQRLHVATPRNRIRENMIIQKDVNIAKANWMDWISVFEHEGVVKKNPLLAFPGLFNKFLGEYRVHRTIRAGTSDEFRKALISEDVGLADKLSDSSGNGIDELEELLRWDFGTRDGERGMRSVISKIAAFLAPQNFIAWDKYARKGIIRQCGRRLTYTYQTYAEYLSDVNFLLNGEMKDALISASQNNYPTQYSAVNNRFQRRVLDVYLMRIGDRWK